METIKLQQLSTLSHSSLGRLSHSLCAIFPLLQFANKRTSFQQQINCALFFRYLFRCELIPQKGAFIHFDGNEMHAIRG